MFAWFKAANVGTSAYPFLTMGNARLLLAHGSQEQIDTYVRPELEGRWFGTMALSEPQAGSSLADITVIGRPAILIPYAAAAGDHQTANAQALAEVGAALIHPESVLDAPGLTRDIRAILNDPARASQMAAAALFLARPDAARRLYDLVTDIAR